MNDAFNNLLWIDDSHLSHVYRCKIETADMKGATNIFVEELPPGPVDIDYICARIKEHHIGTEVTYEDR